MSHFHKLGDIAAAEVARIRAGTARPAGIPSGVGLERFIPGGVPRGKMTAVYSSEGNFKTTFVTQMAVAAADAGYTVLSLTLEDSADLVVHRYLARLTGVPYGVIHSGNMDSAQRDAVLAAEMSPACQRLLVVDDLEPRWDRVEAAVNALTLADGRPGCDMLILDYVQMLGRDPKVLDDAVFGAQRLAKAKNLAIVFVSQQVKSDNQADDPRPKTENMFGSSGLRMGCKVAVGLFRPWGLCKAPTSMRGPYGKYTQWITENPANVALYPNIVEVHITKNFAGPPAAYHLLVTPETGMLEPIHLGFA